MDAWAASRIAEAERVRQFWAFEHEWFDRATARLCPVGEQAFYVQLHCLGFLRHLQRLSEADGVIGGFRST